LANSAQRLSFFFLGKNICAQGDALMGNREDQAEYMKKKQGRNG